MKDKRYFESFRKNIPALESCTYLNTAGSGPLSLQALHTITDSYNRLAYLGQTNADIIQSNKSRLEDVRKNIASFINANETEIFFVRCIAEGVNTIAYMFDWKTDDEVIITDQENPATILPFFNLIRKGIRIKKLHITGEPADVLKEFKELITPKTRLAMVCQVMHSNGIRIPVKEMAAAAHESNIIFAIDAAQSVGVIPANMRELDCDFYLLSGHKWIMGPEGATAVFIRENLIERMAPPFAGVGTQSSFDFIHNTLEYKPGALRYEYGGRHLSLYFAVDSAIRLIQEIGIENIYERSQQLGTYLRKRLSSIPGLTILTPENSDFGSGIVSFKISGCDHQDLVKKAWSKGRIIINWRTLNLYTKEEGIRTSMAWFVQEEELDYFTDFIKLYLSHKFQ